MSIKSINNNTSYFQATLPKSLESTLAKKIAKYVWNFLCATLLFPVGIVRILNHYIIRPFLIKNAILPATHLYKQNYSISPSDLNTNEQLIRLKNAYGEKIEGTFFYGTKYPTKLVILNHGNAVHCLDYKEAYPEIINSGVSILSINHPGVGKSEGRLGTHGLDLEESLGLSVYSAYQYARKKLNFSKKNIVLDGFSVGGLASTIGATFVQEMYGKKAVKLINDRSFSNIVQIGTSLVKKIQKNLNNELSIKNFSLKNVLNTGVVTFIKISIEHLPPIMIPFLLKCLTIIFGLKADAAEAFKKLKGKNKCIIYTKKDNVIPYREASLYQSVKNSCNFSRIKLRKMHKHSTPLEQREAKYLQAQIYEFLKIRDKSTQILKKSHSPDRIYRLIRAS